MNVEPKWARIAALRTAAVVVALLGAAIPVGAGQQLPDASELVARHIEAVGGRDAIEGHTSSHATGSIEVLGQGLTGTLTVYGAAPAKTVVFVSFPAAGVESRTGYDGTVGWSIDSMTGERLLQGKELDQLRDEADFYSDLHAPERFQSIETVERTPFAGHDAYKVRLVYSSGRESFEYFDVDSGRMIGTEGAQESLMGSLNVITVIEEYQRAGDLMVPRKVTQEVGPGQSVQLTIETVEFDSVDPAVFELPDAIKALLGTPR